MKTPISRRAGLRTSNFRCTHTTPVFLNTSTPRDCDYLLRVLQVCCSRRCVTVNSLVSPNQAHPIQDGPGLDSGTCAASQPRTGSTTVLPTAQPFKSCDPPLHNGSEPSCSLGHHVHRDSWEMIIPQRRTTIAYSAWLYNDSETVCDLIHFMTQDPSCRGRSLVNRR